MEAKLKELTERIYQEGVEKARSEAETIVAKAREEARDIVAQAQAQADASAKKAASEAEALKARTLAEVKAASEQAISSLKQQVTDLVSRAAFAGPVSKSFEDVAFIQSVIKEMISHWNPGDQGLSLTLPEAHKIEMQKFFGAKTQESLTAGLDISFDGRFEKGFRIGPKDRSFVISFTDRDFIQLFQSYMKPRTRELLFPGA